MKSLRHGLLFKRASNQKWWRFFFSFWFSFPHSKWWLCHHVDCIHYDVVVFSWFASVSKRQKNDSFFFFFLMLQQYVFFSFSFVRLNPSRRRFELHKMPNGIRHAIVKMYTNVLILIGFLDERWLFFFSFFWFNSLLRFDFKMIYSTPCNIQFRWVYYDARWKHFNFMQINIWTFVYFCIQNGNSEHEFVFSSSSSLTQYFFPFFIIWREPATRHSINV